MKGTLSFKNALVGGIILTVLWYAWPILIVIGICLLSCYVGAWARKTHNNKEAEEEKESEAKDEPEEQEGEDTHA